MKIVHNIIFFIGRLLIWVSGLLFLYCLITLVPKIVMFKWVKNLLSFFNEGLFSKSNIQNLIVISTVTIAFYVTTLPIIGTNTLKSSDALKEVNNGPQMLINNVLFGILSSLCFYILSLLYTSEPLFISLYISMFLILMFSFLDYTLLVLLICLFNLKSTNSMDEIHNDIKQLRRDVNTISLYITNSDPPTTQPRNILTINGKHLNDGNKNK